MCSPKMRRKELHSFKPQVRRRSRNRVSPVPVFGRVAIVGDEPILLAEVLSLFAKPREYVALMDGPRMTRSDASNEVIRRMNALSLSSARHIVLAGLRNDQVGALSEACRPKTLIVADSMAVAAASLKGVVKRREAQLDWSSENLGIGLYLARRSKRELRPGGLASTDQTFVPAGTHMLVVCEQGDEMAQVTASNLAFACDASFLAIPPLTAEEHDEWLEDLYGLGEGGNATQRFAEICNRAKARLPDFPFDKYRQVLFMTKKFPWGIAVPEVPTTHIYSYPDLGRTVLMGMWAALTASTSSRNALLIDPQMVEGSEIPTIAESLARNLTLVRRTSGPMASVHRVQMLLETVPADIIVLSTHAGDAPGERATYAYVDSDGRERRLTVDHAVGIGYDPSTDLYPVQEFHHFHELDGVHWTDAAGKAALPVGSAIRSWHALGGARDRNRFKIRSEAIPRVHGSMALQMHDGIWIAAVQGFAPSSAPLILNNSCSSWHELGLRFTFAGARGYVGTLFPITDPEAQEIGRALFDRQLGQPLPIALWQAQNSVYGNQDRRPYAMVGLPFVAIRRNYVNSVRYLDQEYELAIAEYEHKASTSTFADVRENSKRYADFLRRDRETFRRGIAAVGQQ